MLLARPAKDRPINVGADASVCPKNNNKTVGAGFHARPTDKKINLKCRGTGHRAQKGINYAYNSGITLIALIITIIVLIILAGVTLNVTLGENGILTKSKQAVDTYQESSIIEQIRLDITAKEMETTFSITESEFNEILAKYGTISEDRTILTTNERELEIEISEIWNGKIIPDPAIGDYVSYNVTYTDMYTEHPFTGTDGWRILDVGEKNADGTYTGTKLISTGIPAMLSYDVNTVKSFEYDEKTEGHWAGDSTQRGNYVNAFNITPYSSNDDYNIYAAAGLYYNFRKITFVQGTSALDNKGYYTKVNGKESGNLVEDEFVINEIAEEVHNITLAELNEARGYTDLTSTTSTETKDGDTGLFYLRNLASENSSFGYTSGSSCLYWLASPDSSNADGLRRVDYSGIISYSISYTRGVRPVVSLKSNITLKTTGEDEHWTIE